MLTLAQLLSPQTYAIWRARLFAALQGLGLVQPGGTAGGGVANGTGSVSLSGTPAAAYPSVIISITTAGELGAAAYKYSLDGGSTYSAPATVPGGGTAAIGSTGVTATFTPGPSGGGTSFAVGDTFSFGLNVPALGVTAWQSGSALRTLTEIDAAVDADFSQAQLVVAAAYFLQAWLAPTSLGLSAPPPDAWLDMVGTNVYGLSRIPATASQRLATLTAAATAGPYTINAGAMWVADAGGKRFSNLTGGTLARGGTLQLTWVAEAPGSGWNSITGSLSIIGGTLAGVTVADNGLSVSGTDAETNVAYATRCQSRWPSLASPGTSPSAVFKLWALAAESAAGHGTTVSRVLIYADSATPGQVDVYIAGAIGVVADQAATDVDAYIQPRVGLTNSAVVHKATASAITVTGTVNYVGAMVTLAAVQASVAAALASYINGIAISDGGSTAKVYWSEVLAAVGAQLGVRDVATLQINGGTTDVALTLGQIATLTNSLAYTAV
jgi:hypothetical protein